MLLCSGVSYLYGLWRDIRNGIGQTDLLWLGLTATVCMVASLFVPSPVSRSAGALLRLSGLVQDNSNYAWTQAGLHLVRGIMYLFFPLFSLFLLRLRPRDVGWKWGKWQVWLRDSVFFYLVVFFVLYWASRQPSFRRVYPYLLLSRMGGGGFFLAQTIRLLYMVGWEFLFRGYLLFGFSRQAGNAVGIVVSTIPFVLMHIGKPAAEIWGSVAAGVILSVLALRGCSFLPAALVHYSAAVTLDLLVLYG